MSPVFYFYALTLEQTTDILCWAIGENNQALNLSEDIEIVYPGLLQEVEGVIDRNLLKRKVTQFIQNDFEQQTRKQQAILKQTETDWKLYQDSYFKVMGTYFNTIPSKQSIHIGIGPIPCCPRMVQTRDMELCYMDARSMIAAIMHECCHFLFFEKWKQIYPEWNCDDFDNSNTMIWYLSEVVIDAILNSKSVQTIFSYPHEGYDSFYSIEIEGDNMMNKISEIYQNYPIEEAMKISYTYLNDNKRTIWEQTDQQNHGDIPKK